LGGFRRQLQTVSSNFQEAAHKGWLKS
jgi:hypothetical protein